MCKTWQYGDESLLCFLYASFDSPDIHLTFLVSKFAVAQSRETFEKWLLTWHKLAGVTVMNNFPMYHLDCNGRCFQGVFWILKYPCYQGHDVLTQK